MGTGAIRPQGKGSLDAVENMNAGEGGPVFKKRDSHMGKGKGTNVQRENRREEGVASLPGDKKRKKTSPGGGGRRPKTEGRLYQVFEEKRGARCKGEWLEKVKKRRYATVKRGERTVERKKKKTTSNLQGTKHSRTVCVKRGGATKRQEKR